MVHRECHEGSECWEINEYKKGFPKQFCEFTQLADNGYPFYQRKDNSVEATEGKYQNNRWVVPYNRILLLKYNAHINVEHCASFNSIKYIFKYVFKLSDISRFQVISNSNEDGSPQKVSVDEVQNYIDGLYMCVHETYMKIMGVAQQCLSHSVIRLAILLPNEQFVYFQEGNQTSAALNPNSNKTTLTAFFTLKEEYNKQFGDEINESEYDQRKYSYDQIPKHFTFDNATKLWKPKLDGKKTIGRLYNVSLKELELFCMRDLQFHIKGPISFETLRKIDQIQFESFLDAAAACRLLEDDKLLRNTLLEACTFKMPSALKHLLIVIIKQCSPRNPAQLWTKFPLQLSEDFLNRRQQINNTSGQMPSVHEIEFAKDDAFHDLENILQNPAINLRHLLNWNEVQNYQTFDLLQQGNVLESMNQLLDQLNDEQKEIAQLIIEKLNHSYFQHSRIIFVDGSAGTGKTFLYNVMNKIVNLISKKILNCAWTGIAVRLLSQGQSSHSLFKLSVPLTSSKNSSKIIYAKNGLLWNYLQLVDVIIWDEAPMASK